MVKKWFMLFVNCYSLLVMWYSGHTQWIHCTLYSRVSKLFLWPQTNIQKRNGPNTPPTHTPRAKQHPVAVTMLAGKPQPLTHCCFVKSFDVRHSDILKRNKIIYSFIVMLYFTAHSLPSIYWVSTKYLFGNYFDFKGNYYDGKLHSHGIYWLCFTILTT